MSPIFSVNITPLISVSHCLGIHVAQPMKEKIWAKDYIDLSKLVQPDQDTDKTDQHKFAVLDGQLVMKPKIVQRKLHLLKHGRMHLLYLLANISPSRLPRHTKIYANH